MQNPIVKYVLNNHILATVLLVALALFLYQIRSILLALFISYIIMAALTPIVRGLKRFRLPNFLTVTVVYSLVIAAIVLLVVPILPFFISQIQALFKAIPTYLNLASQVLGFQVSNAQIENYLSPLTGLIGQNALSFTTRFFGGIFTVISIFVLSFYMLIEREKIGREIPNLLPERYRQKIILTIHLVEQKLGAWLRGQIVLSLVVGTITWIVLTVLGVPFALPLAILAGILEIIPTLGPIIAAIPAVIVGLAISPVMAVSVVLAYIGIQLAENNILVPKIMQKAVGLNPVVIIVAILIGARLFGVMGALLSIPFVSAAIITIRSFK
ncbi:MAG: AI-2E family transporter [Candidatus Levybacteria bacterium]|nr:AI-2E family transporter [Candidatus Levybacteria bacterium]